MYLPVLQALSAVRAMVQQQPYFKVFPLWQSRWGVLVRVRACAFSCAILNAIRTNCNPHFVGFPNVLVRAVRRHPNSNGGTTSSEHHIGSYTSHALHEGTRVLQAVETMNTECGSILASLRLLVGLVLFVV